MSSTGMMPTHQQPFYFGNNNFHQTFQSEKSKFSTQEEDARWFEAFNYFRAIKPEPLELNPGFQNFQAPPAHFYQQQYQNGFTTTPPQFYFHTQNIIQNNINNRVQNIFANDATVHQDDNNTLVNLGFPGGQLHSSMESRSQVDSYYYSASTENTNRHRGLNQTQSEDNSSRKYSSNSNKEQQDKSTSENDASDKSNQEDNNSKMLEDESKK